MRQEMLMSIHTVHMGIQKSKERARDVLYWPGMTKEIENHVSRCSTCQEYQKPSTKKTVASSLHSKSSLANGVNGRLVLVERCKLSAHSGLL